MMPRLAAALALAALAPIAGALEPRYDHRDQRGLSVEAFFAHDTVVAPGAEGKGRWRNGLRLAYALEVSGEGDEIALGVLGAPWQSDPDRTRVRLALDARYRGYFGSEEFKTFFDLGIWAPLEPRLAVGPLVGVGVQYDFGRVAGVFAGGGFQTAFGRYRIAGLTGTIGAQARW
jgi:hypothetical protein